MLEQIVLFHASRNLALLVTVKYREQRWEDMAALIKLHQHAVQNSNIPSEA